MKKSEWKVYGLGILITEAVGALAGWLTGEGVRAYMASVIKPPLSPPGVVFPVVWTILYALMGIGAARVYLSPWSRERTAALAVFAVQLVFNFLWSFIFFNLENYGLALLWLAALWLLILLMINAFRKVDKTAALLQIPYLVWVTFAAYLNFGVWLLNR